MVFKKTTNSCPTKLKPLGVKYKLKSNKIVFIEINVLFLYATVVTKILK